MILARTRTYLSRKRALCRCRRHRRCRRRRMQRVAATPTLVSSSSSNNNNNCRPSEAKRYSNVPLIALWLPLSLLLHSLFFLQRGNHLNAFSNCYLSLLGNSYATLTMIWTHCFLTSPYTYMSLSFYPQLFLSCSLPFSAFIIQVHCEYFLRFIFKVFSTCFGFVVLPLTRLRSSYGLRSESRVLLFKCSFPEECHNKVVKLTSIINYHASKN